jgi:hypothetical protein
MLPQQITCDECHATARIRGCGRIEYDWPSDNELDARDPTQPPVIRSARLTVDCPTCGVRVQDHYPNGRPAADPAAQRALLNRLKTISATLRS